MYFEVIIGNPPYQRSEKGCSNLVVPIYHRFVNQAKRICPRFVVMIIPARWYSGGKEMQEFRKEMLKDSRIRVLVDYPDSTECFPKVDLSGGICYFLWDREFNGICKVTTVVKGEKSNLDRYLLEYDFDVFIRYNDALSIVRKVQELKERSFSEVVSTQTPFGIPTNFKKLAIHPYQNAIKIYARNRIGYIDIEEVRQNRQWVPRWKVYISKAYGERITSSFRVLGVPFLGEPDTCCTGTYLVIGPFSTRDECLNVISYIKCRFFRFLVMLNKLTQHASRRVYSLVPIQDFSKSWTDEELYNRYELNVQEIGFIQKMVREMV